MTEVTNVIPVNGNFVVFISVCGLRLSTRV